VRRRDFLTLLGGASALWPRALCAQQSHPVVGFLHSATLQSRRESVAAFLNGLGEAGYGDGRNVTIEFRWAHNDISRLPALAADLVQRNVAVLFAGGPPPARAAKAATTTIPIVFTTGDDPVTTGLVTSLNRPGGNITGVHFFLNVIESKRLGLLHELVPSAGRVGVLINPQSANIDEQLGDLRAAANAIGWQLVTARAAIAPEVDSAIAELVRSQVKALLVTSNPFFNSQRDQLVALAARHALPAIYGLREFAAAGGLMSYGTSQPDAYYQAGLYTGRILKGESPGELPVMQSTKFEFVINLKTAASLGLTIPPTLLARAEEVIE
jgi:putative ABC transport system substrate-binding protein